MSTKVILAIVGVVVIVGGAVLYFGDGERGARQATTENGTSAESNDADANERIPESGMASLPELIRLGSNLRCEFSYTDPETGGVMNGTMYIADRGEAFRGDFTMMQDGQTHETHMIMRDGTGYTWSETAYGRMAVMFEIAEDENFFDATDEESFDMEEEYEYSCSRWRVDASLLTPPSDIEFTDMTEMMMNMGGGGSEADMKARQCAACESISDASMQAQCKAALECN